MYNFIDVTEKPEGTLLPSEALKINGEYIENLIPGYRTLTVEGREALSREIEAFEMGIRDGAEMKGARYPARTIRVTYQLLCATNEEFRTAYNKLGGILSVKNAELIFEDEPDKYFIGTPTLIGDVTPGRNSVVGEFEIVCLDPFKYSVMEFEAAADPGSSSIFVDYGGTYKSFPKLVAEFHKESEASEDGETTQALTGDGECGFVAFFNEDEKIIQLGDPDETDGNSQGYSASQTLINASFTNSNAWGTAAKSQWTVNNGALSSSTIKQNGTPGILAASYTGGNSGKTFSNRVLKVTSQYERPYVHYEVWVYATNRTENSADITVKVLARLDNSDSYFKRGYVLEGVFRIGDNGRAISLKKKDEVWQGTAEHSCSVVYKNYPLDAENFYLPEMSLTMTRPDGLGNTGVLPRTKCGNFIVPAYEAATPDSWQLGLASYGSDATMWNGTTISRTIPADASGNANHYYFSASFCAKICAVEAKERGSFEFHIVTGGVNKIAGIQCRKSATGTKAVLDFYVNNIRKESVTIDISEQGEIFTEKSSISITKMGATVTFVCGKKITKSYTDSAIKTINAQSVTVGFFRFSTTPPLTYNGLRWVKFVKNHCNTWKDIPNKFKTNDVCEADCKTGEITLNGAAANALGALGNDWEGFYLTPGLNQIGTAFSDWVDEGCEPTFKVKYREVYL